MDIAVYGAQGIALGTCNSIRIMCPYRKIRCFLVSEMGKNAPSLGGIPVRELHDFAAELSDTDKDSIQILIATPEDVMDTIEDSLEAYGFYNYVRIDSQRWADMQRSFFGRNSEFMPIEAYPAGKNCSELHIYKAVFHGDRKLRKEYAYPDYIVPIQVGAARTCVRIAEILDNSGENISDKNGNYSELTGLYWIWRNRLVNHYYGDDCYYGLVHYRRLFDISSEDILRLKDNDIDVILPYPMPYEPDIEEHHKRYLSDSEWNAVLQALKELYPQYAEAGKEILGQNYFYNYNIIIAKSTVLEAYCEWLFTLLLRIEEINSSEGTKKQNRYMGYVGETLETIYFMYNKSRLHIAHAGCKFLV